MRLSRIFTLAIFFSFPLFAGMAPEEKCEKRGDVAKQASEMRISGVDKETATNSLIDTYDRPGTGVTANNVRGLVMMSYMAKMKPENMRNYTIDQCKKDILK
jgi:hypothetical protein